MEENGTEEKALKIVNDLAKQGLNIKEALQVLKTADGFIRRMWGVTVEKTREKASLSALLRETECQDSSDMKSPDEKLSPFSSLFG